MQVSRWDYVVRDGGFFRPPQTDKQKSHFTFTLYMCQNSVLNTRAKIRTYVIGTNQAGNFAKSTCNFTSVAAERNLPRHLGDLPLKLGEQVCRIFSSFSSKFIPYSTSWSYWHINCKLGQ